MAEKTNAAKSDFLSSMSHELRSPLNAILGFAQLMESEKPRPSPVQTDRIAQILRAGWHLLKLINEILDLAAIESGQLSLSRETVSLATVMTDCRTMMEPLAQGRNIRMTFPQFDHPLFVQADMTRLKQVVINLLSNAIKYNRDQGEVTVECILVAPARIRLTIRDTGAGLEPDRLAQLFQPFNRLGQETSDVAGTGIGLVVTKRLTELMGGVLGVESTPGVGSVFWCELAAATAPQLAPADRALAPASRPPIPADAPRRTILCVEDNPANMELVGQLIARRPDLCLATAVNGTLGLELAREIQPAVILMDINLPGISGIEALRLLRARPADGAYPGRGAERQCHAARHRAGLEAGFHRYLTKPIKVGEFMDALDASLSFAPPPLGPST